MSYVIIPRYGKVGEGFSKIERLQAEEHPGRRTNPQRGYQSPSTWITHLLDCRKPLVLCGFCRHKFDPKKARYRRFFCLDSNGQNGFITNGQCEDCKEDTRRSPGQGTCFIAEETYSQVCLEPGPSRRSMRARLSFAGMTAWGMIQSLRS